MKEGNKILTNTYASKYQEILLNAKVKDLFEFHSDYFKKYVKGDSYGEAVKIFNEYGDETYQTILGKVIEAQEKLKSKSPNLTEKDKEKAQEIIDKYGRITTPIQAFEQKEMRKLSDPIEDSAIEKDLTEMFKPKDKSEKK
jgi:hypothetical protein